MFKGMGSAIEMNVVQEIHIACMTLTFLRMLIECSNVGALVVDKGQWGPKQILLIIIG